MVWPFNRYDRYNRDNRYNRNHLHSIEISFNLIEEKKCFTIIGCQLKYCRCCCPNWYGYGNEFGNEFGFGYERLTKTGGDGGSEGVGDGGGVDVDVVGGLSADAFAATNLLNYLLKKNKFTSVLVTVIVMTMVMTFFLAKT